MTKTNQLSNIAADAIDEIGPVKALKSIWDGMVSKKIESVFKNCAQQLKNEGNIEEKFKEKLNKYAESEFGQETVYSLVQKSITADSKECCKILGVLLGKAMAENRPLKQQERVLSEALRSITDHDLLLLQQIYATANQVPIHPDIIKQADGDQQKLQAQLQRNSLSLSDFYQCGLLTGNQDDNFYSLERLKKYDILTAYAVYGGSAVSSTQNLFKFTDLSVELIGLAKQVI